MPLANESSKGVDLRLSRYHADRLVTFLKAGRFPDVSILEAWVGPTAESMELRLAGPTAELLDRVRSGAYGAFEIAHVDLPPPRSTPEVRRAPVAENVHGWRTSTPPSWTRSASRNLGRLLVMAGNPMTWSGLLAWSVLASPALLYCWYNVPEAKGYIVTFYVCWLIVKYPLITLAMAIAFTAGLLRGGRSRR